MVELGSDKTIGICDLWDEVSRQGGTSWWVAISHVAVAAPKNGLREAALENLLLTALGLEVWGRWSERKYLLFELPM